MIKKKKKKLYYPSAELSSSTLVTSRIDQCIMRQNTFRAKTTPRVYSVVFERFQHVQKYFSQHALCLTDCLGGGGGGGGEKKEEKKKEENLLMLTGKIPEITN